MKLDPKAIRYLSADDWRTLTAVEMGSKNHEVVPTPLIVQIAGLRGGNSAHKSISTLAKSGLIAKVKNSKYDGYRLTYGGLDYLALNAHRKSSAVYSLGPQLGVGKESDIFAVAHQSGAQRVLKLHRLGRISFRDVKSTRDYLRGRSTGSWMYMARLAALKEYAVMQALHSHDFPVPQPIAQNRHTVVMSLVEGWPLVKIKEVRDPAKLYGELMDLLVRLARHGLIHGDFNEFNILIEEHHSASDPEDELPEVAPVLIDFPQILSISHPNAEFYFDRDVNCVKRFFQRRFHFQSDEPGPFLADALRNMKNEEGKLFPRLDVEVEAAGFSRKMARELDEYMSRIEKNEDCGEREGDGEVGCEDESGEDYEVERTKEDKNDEYQVETHVVSENAEKEVELHREALEDCEGPSQMDTLTHQLSNFVPLAGPTKANEKITTAHLKAAGWSI